MVNTVERYNCPLFELNDFLDWVKPFNKNHPDLPEHTAYSL